ncbi:hypothetical protein GUITHDRAFT_103372 [Guillardia theta CCMP2712]|uniref:Metallo-beta-lactamase domain-containing protein n=1 Tax=Guillardia theta (strain CCMP2712) TaxID=905079 RepID=L1JQT1_GUITC|nr:hypothetical protein GUITHDRAFT_103372 [Guillardia theta CCMP2712]EKX50782.1 hypothetical protein GUITHDRAFT_103372 [Guillardia theta CCMP2712]|eukprot:XP_005837762.1 hypothetical protein GUITHDRAFT_103372 [Guillardia theta CCMP2712]
MPKCHVCHDAMRESSKNRRGNVSILLRFWHKDGRPRHIMVDAGKTMRENCMRFLPQHGVRSLDSLLLTHSHADAIHGLDDIRDFQEQSGVILKHFPPLPVYLNEATFDEIAHADLKLSGAWFVSRIRWNIISDEEFEVEGCEGLKVRPLPVLHGGSLISLGFEFKSDKYGSKGRRRSTLDSNDQAKIRLHLGRQPHPLQSSPLSQELSAPAGEPSCLFAEIRPDLSGQVLVLDALDEKKHFSHFNLQEAVDAAAEISPRKLLLVGMTCSMGDHEETNRKLIALRPARRCSCDQCAGLPLSVELAHDGQFLDSREWGR